MACNHRRRFGIVTNQAGEYNSDIAHMSVTVCEREKCIIEAAQKVAAFTLMVPYIIPDSDRVARVITHVGTQ